MYFCVYEMGSAMCDNTWKTETKVSIGIGGRETS